MKEDVLDTVRRLGHGVVDMAQGRLKLIQSELTDELDHLGALLARMVLVAFCGLLTVQMLALVVMAAAWDTQWRVACAVVLVLIAAVGTVAAYRAYRLSQQRKRPIFATSLNELEKDRRVLEKSL